MTPVMTPGGPIATLRAGTEGPVVLLVPGYTGSKEDFRFVVEPLAAQGFCVVAIDQRGQHESTGPDDPDAYAIEALAGDLLAVIDELGEPVHLVGHSFGGLVARAAVIRDPAAARSLTLLCSGPAALHSPRTEAVALLRPLLESDGLVAVADLLDAMADPAEPAELRSFLRRRFLATNPIGLVAMADALASEVDRVDELRATGIRLLVAYGESDDAWSPAVQADMAQRLDAAHVVIADAAHSPAVENPDATVAALAGFFSE
jgi:pimeloyl-ACP methyl ester carboxylesterase